jgi:hypothetical protein
VVAKQHIPQYEQLVKAGSYLVVVHGAEQVDRKGFLKSDAYVAADEIDRVQDGAVRLAVTDKEMLKEAGV